MADGSPTREDLQAAVRDLFADGHSRKGVAERLMETFGISSATAYRRIAEAMPDTAIETDDTHRVADLAIGALARLLMKAEDDGRDADIERLAVSLATVASKLKATQIPL